MAIRRHKRKTNRPYRRITVETVAKHRAQALISGNGSQAVRDIDGDYEAEGQRAYRIVKKSEDMPNSQYIDESLQTIATGAVRELGELVHHNDPNIRTRNVHYVIDQVKGKAMTKNLNINKAMTVEDILA